MKLRETILKEHSKANCMRIVKWVGNDQKRFDELFNLFLNDGFIGLLQDGIFINRHHQQWHQVFEHRSAPG